MTALQIEDWNSKRFGGIGAPKLRARARPIRALVIHSTEGHEREGSARNSCSWFDSPASKGNAHFVCDADNIVRFADDDRDAWHANAASPWSLGIEIAGKASQTGEQWLDDWSKACLTNAAKLCAYLCVLHGIEVRRLADDQIRWIHANTAGCTGFLAHADVSRVLKSGTHHDPGPSFPWLQFLIAVRGYIELGAA